MSTNNVASHIAKFPINEQPCNNKEQCFLVVNQVSREMESVPVVHPLLPGDNAVLELTELVMYAERVRAVAQEFQKIVYSGAPILICDIDRDATARAGNTVFRHYIDEGMKRILIACRAGQFIDGDLGWVKDHGSIPPV